MEASYDVVSIIKEKYVFSQRPGLIVQENLRNLTRIGG
jgi:chromosome transmission fidelity protein 8